MEDVYGMNSGLTKLCDDVDSQLSIRTLQDKTEVKKERLYVISFLHCQ